MEQLRKIISRQLWLKSHVDIEYQCYAMKMTEMEFFQHYLWIWALHNDILDFIPKGIGDEDYSEGVRFE